MEVHPVLLFFSQYPLPTSFLFFTTVYLLAFLLIFRNWHPSTRPHASSSLLSLSHGTPALLLATLSLLLQPQDTTTTTSTSTSTNNNKTQYSNIINFASPNTPLQNLTLDFSAAYFLTDLLHYLLFVPPDPLFVAHHAATLYVFLTCRHAVRRGARPLLFLLVLAEATSPCQNVWSLAGFLRRRGGVGDSSSPAAADRLHGLLSPVFYSAYTVVRGVVGPAFAWEMGRFYLRGGGEGVIPRWAWGSWMVVIVSGILLSVLWVWKRWVEWCGERRKSD